MGAALLTVGVYVLLNYAANHLWAIPGGRIGYLLVVPILAGIVLPTWAIVRLARDGRADLGDWGVRLRRRDVVAIPAAVVAGTVVLWLVVDGGPGASPGRLAALAAQLIPPSVAESFVFLGVLFNVVRRWGRHPGDAFATGAAALVASVAFGFYHVSFYPPWNTVAVASRLTLVWLAVSGVFVLSGSLWAAAAFNTLMAVTGFVVNRVTRLDAEPVAAGALVACLALIAPVLVRAAVGSAPEERR